MRGMPLYLAIGFACWLVGQIINGAATVAAQSKGEGCGPADQIVCMLEIR